MRKLFGSSRVQQGMRWAITTIGCVWITVLTSCQSTHSTIQTRRALPDFRVIDSLQLAFAPGALDHMEFKPAVFGPATMLSIARTGKVRFNYQSAPHTGSGGLVVNKEWDLKPDETGKLLDGLVADGLLELEGSPKYTGEAFTVTCGKWQYTATSVTITLEMLMRLRPYLNEGETAVKALTSVPSISVDMPKSAASH